MRTEEVCESDFRRQGPYWHLYTPGERTEIIFTCDEEFIFGMNLVALCLALFPGLRILSFTLMNNHFHFILAGSREDAEAFFVMYRRRLKRYLTGRGRYADLSALKADMFEIPDLRALRSEIVYVNRNGYIVQPDHTPYSYPWSAGVFYFNPMLERMVIGEPLAGLSYRDSRQLFRGRTFPLPDSYRIIDGMILPSSYCCIREGEGYFRNAHQYFYSLSKDQESKSAISRRLNDSAFLTDEELFGVARGLCAKAYDGLAPAMLPLPAKKEMAIKMHYDYKATVNQVRRIFRMDPVVLKEMFPRAAL